jgi:DNA-binding HxlR family transcriptional regulator
MSDTPRTNLEAFFPHESMYQVCDADFCRQLERELNAANEMFRKLNIHALNLTDRIRRLEEAGDLMVQHFYTDEPRSEMWEKAKEAKP